MAMDFRDNAMVYGGGIVGAFVLALIFFGPGPRRSTTPMAPELAAEFRQERTSLPTKKAPAEVEFRAPGAYYPEEDARNESMAIDPLVAAGIGGGLVFGLFGAGSFLLLGGLRRRSDEPDALGSEPTIGA